MEKSARRRQYCKGKKQLFTQRFPSAGNYRFIVPSGCEEIDVFLVGAGGGAGGTTNPAWGWDGGGGGGYTMTYRGRGYVKPASGTWMGTATEGRDGNALAVTPGQTITAKVGAGQPNADGESSTFGSLSAGGGKASKAYRPGGAGGSGGGSWFATPDSNFGLYAGGLSDGRTGHSVQGASQGHTTRDFGEPTGLRNAGGGTAHSQMSTPEAGISDYSAGSGEYAAVNFRDTQGRLWRTATKGAGGYGGGASAGDPTHETFRLTKGGDGTVLIRYYAYREGIITKI